MRPEASEADPAIKVGHLAWLDRSRTLLLARPPEVGDILLAVTGFGFVA